MGKKYTALAIEKAFIKNKIKANFKDGLLSIDIPKIDDISNSDIIDIRPRVAAYNTSSSSSPFDFVSRNFAPKLGIPEDPVTGSAHTTLIPYWSNKLKENTLHAKQISARGGELFCTNEENRVLIGGNAVLYMKGEIEIS